MTAPPAPPARPAARPLRGLASFGAGVVVGAVLVGVGPSLSAMGLVDLGLIGGGIALVAIVLRRRHAGPGRSMPVAVRARRRLEEPPAPAALPVPSGDGSGFDRGLRDIRRTDPGFDPAKLAGYTAMVFRDVHNAWTTGEIRGLRDRLTPQMYDELHARCARLGNARPSSRADRVEIRAEITEAWQENGQDYVTAYIGGSMVDDTVEAVSDGLVNGSSAAPKDVDEFWTFTRPAGLNFWMLSGIQPS